MFGLLFQLSCISLCVGAMFAPGSLFVPSALFHPLDSDALNVTRQNSIHVTSLSKDSMLEKTSKDFTSVTLLLLGIITSRMGKVYFKHL